MLWLLIIFKIFHLLASLRSVCATTLRILVHKCPGLISSGKDFDSIGNDPMHLPPILIKPYFTEFDWFWCPCFLSLLICQIIFDVVLK